MTVWLGAVAFALNALHAHPQTTSGLDAATSNTIAPVAITGVTVVDVEAGTHKPGLTILTQGDRIAAVGSEIAVPRGAIRISGRGKFLIPGLWDMHTHHQGTGAGSLDLFVAKGVVGTRDMGGDADFILPLREQVRAATVFGPEIVVSGPMVDNAP